MAVLKPPVMVYYFDNGVHEITYGLSIVNDRYVVSLYNIKLT